VFAVLLQIKQSFTFCLHSIDSKIIKKWLDSWNDTKNS